MSLAGKRIVVTRAPHQTDGLAALLRERGAEPLLFPCIDIAPPEDTTQLDNVLRNLHEFDWLLLTSTNTVIALQRQLETPGIDAGAMHHLSVGAVGRKTAKQTQLRLALSVDVVPDEQSAEGLLQALPDMNGKRVFLPQSAIARDVLREQLTSCGAEVTVVEAYRIVTGPGGVSVDVVEAADAVAFTSPSAVHGLVERCGTVLDVSVACIGPTTAKAAIDVGFKRVIQPETDYSLAGMLEALEMIIMETVS